MVKADVAYEPLQLPRQLVIRTTLQGGQRVIPQLLFHRSGCWYWTTNVRQIVLIHTHWR